MKKIPDSCYKRSPTYLPVTVYDSKPTVNYLGPMSFNTEPSMGSLPNDTNLWTYSPGPLIFNLDVVKLHKRPIALEIASSLRDHKLMYFDVLHTRQWHMSTEGSEIQHCQITCKVYGRSLVVTADRWTDR
jgi:hypothetical protein